MGRAGMDLRGGNYLDKHYGGKIEFLSEDDINRIIESSISILEDTGIVFHSPKALEIMRDDDRVKINSSENKIHLKRDLIMESIENAPQEFRMHARNPENSIDIEPNAVYFGPMIGRIKIYDYEEKEIRNTNLEDVGNLIKLADALDTYSLLHSGAVMPQIEGVPDEEVHLQGYLKSIENSSKIIKASARGTRVAKDCLNMASILAGGRDILEKKPLIYTTVNSVSPLQFPRDLLDGLIEYAEMRQPIDIAPEIQAGASGPVTISGILTLQTAEVLAGITLIQSVSPGAPCFYGTCSTIMDMRIGNIALGSIETGLINVASAQIARELGLAVRGSAGDTESKTFDIQNGYERTSNMLMAAMAGINYIFYPGTLETAKTISLEQLMIDNEICGMIQRVLKGIRVDDDTIAEELIKSVGPGSDYISQSHTMKYLEDEQYMPKLSDRSSREDWKKRGSRSIDEIAHEKVIEILDEHEPDKIDEDIHAELRRYVTEN